MKKLFILVGLFIFICISSVAQSEIIQLTENSYQDVSPQINNSGYVVWYGGIWQSEEIFLYDGTDIVQLTNNSDSDWNAQINDSGHIVWQRVDNSFVAEIFLYDGSSITQLSTTGGTNPQINSSGLVVWEDGYSVDSEIYIYDGTTIHRLTDNSFDDHDPLIDNNGNVLWQRNDGSDEEIFLFNGTTITQLTDNNYDDLTPQINNGDVVWYRSDGSDDEIFLYDGTTTTQLTHNNYNDIVPQINNGYVVWQGGNGSDVEIFLYDGTTTTQLTDNKYWDIGPLVNSSGQVAWNGCDSGDCTDSSSVINPDFEIFFFNGATTARITDNNIDDRVVQVNNSGQIVWSKLPWSGADTQEIFLYTPESPSPDIRANSFDGPITISQSDILSVTGQLDANSMSGQDADWWVLANTPISPPDDWYYFDLNSGWIPGMSVTHQGPLFDLSPYEVLNMSGLPLGTYTLYFGVDMIMNGSLDMGQAYYDSVIVNITQ